MRKLTHLKKAVSLAVAAAMAVSVCTTALADDETEATPEQTVATQSAQTEESNDIAVESAEPDVQSEEEENEENAVATQAADDTDAGYEKVDENTYNVTTQAGLDAVVDDIADKENVTINLSGGKFTTKGKNIKAKKLTIVGQGDNTVQESLQTTFGENEYGANYSFENVDVTFKNLTIDFGSNSADYNGFIRPKELTLENCTVKGMLTYCGYNKATFKNVTFDMPQDYAHKYNMWAYDAAEFVFEDCTFKSYSGKFINAYIEEKNADGKCKSLSFTGCHFIGTGAQDKAVANIKNITPWNVTFKDCDYENVKVDPTTGSAFYQVDTSKPNDATTVTIDGSTVWQNNQRVTPVAAIGDTKYSTLSAAFATAQTGETITLLNDVKLDNVIEFGNTESDKNKTITLDLGGHTLSRNGYALDLYSGELTLRNGKVLTEANKGTATVWLNNDASLIVEKDAEIASSDPEKQSFAIAFDASSTNANLVVRGKLTGGNGLTVNGLVAENTHNVIVLDGATIDVNGQGLYLAGPADTTVAVNESVINGGTGIEIRAGKLTVNNSKISGNSEFTSVSNPGGSTTTGVGIAVAQHTTKLPIDVTVNGGEISGTYALYEANPENNPAEDIAKVHITVNDGKFNGTKEAVLTNDEDTMTVVGGLFSTGDLDKYVRDDSKAVIKNTDAATKDVYPYTIGDKVVNEEITAEVKTGETKAEVSEEIKDENKDSAKETAKNTALSTDAKTAESMKNAGEAAAKQEIQPVLDEVKKQELQDLVGGTTALDPTYTVITYLDVQTKGYDADEDSKLLTLDITPKYDIVLTNGAVTDVNNLQDHVVVATGKDLDVTGAVTVQVGVDGEVATKLQENSDNIYVLHVHNGVNYLYKAEFDANTNTLTFVNPNGFSDFTVMLGSDKKISIDFDGTVNEYGVDDATNNTAMPTATKPGYKFTGWKIGDTVYTKVTYDLWNTLGTDTVTATAQFVEDGTAATPTPTPSPSPKPDATPTPAPTQKPAEPESTATPAPTQKPAAPAEDNNTTATATPAPTKAPASDAGYYTCKQCGHHDWVATADGYKCTNCGHLESVKQLSGYKNVKGVYEPKTSAAKATAKATASKIPQTSDDMPIVPIAIVAIAALLGLCVTVVLKKKHN